MKELLAKGKEVPRGQGTGEREQRMDETKEGKSIERLSLSWIRGKGDQQVRWSGIGIGGKGSQGLGEKRRIVIAGDLIERRKELVCRKEKEDERYRSRTLSRTGYPEESDAVSILILSLSRLEKPSFFFFATPQFPQPFPSFLKTNSSFSSLLEPLTHIDDEYAQAGLEDPRVLITTSRDPSSKLAQFAKVRFLPISHLPPFL